MMTFRKVVGIPGVLLIMDYTGVLLSGWGYMEGQPFYELEYRKRSGKLSFIYLQGPFKKA